MLGLMDELEIPGAYVVGNSMDGRVAIEMALMAPERIVALALLCPAVAWIRGVGSDGVACRTDRRTGGIRPSARKVAPAQAHRRVPAVARAGREAEKLTSRLGHLPVALRQAHNFEIVATAITATPSSRPTNPMPSPRVALTLT